MPSRMRSRAADTSSCAIRRAGCSAIMPSSVPAGVSRWTICSVSEAATSVQRTLFSRRALWNTRVPSRVTRGRDHPPPFTRKTNAKSDKDEISFKFAALAFDRLGLAAGADCAGRFRPAEPGRRGANHDRPSAQRQGIRQRGRAAAQSAGGAHRSESGQSRVLLRRRRRRRRHAGAQRGRHMDRPGLLHAGVSVVRPSDRHPDRQKS